MDKSERFWDKAANTYDQEEDKDKQTHNKIIEKTEKYLKISDIVLDYGCGTGRISNEIADNVKLIHAIDISSKMIEIAKKKAEGRKSELEDLIADGNFEIVETECLHRGSQQYFIVAKKV